MRHYPDWLSQGAEVLVEDLQQEGHDALFDVVIVGSGYGGSVAAAHFAAMQSADGKPLRVCVLERGREYVPGTFPNQFSNLPGHVRFSRPDEAGPKGPRDGLFDFRIGDDVNALVGNGLGGGSLINASVAERPRDDVFEDPAWPAALRADLARLREDYGTATRLLGAQPADTEDVAKYEALRSFASTLGLDARPVTVAVSREEGVNPHGVNQKSCVRCGSCVTGCNFWAKNTLPMNYLADAKRRGARLFTGATVSHIVKDDATWKVNFRLTVPSHPKVARAPYTLRARHVVLAAGTYGSTEILLRSRAKGLRLSSELGTRFSGNGDMISVHYGYPGTVNAAPREHAGRDGPKVGTTITGMFEAGHSRADRVVVQELAIPGALRRIFEEVVTTSALPVQLSRTDTSTHRSEGADPAAVDPDLVERSQVLASFGDDHADGHLEMVEGWDDKLPDGAIRVAWKGAGDGDVFIRQDKLLAKSELLGGMYLRSPLWKPLPEALSDMLSGPKPDGKLFTVHPLGGCPMGDDATAGVVDDIGRVFDPTEPADRARVHDGLLVLDGSIVPVALGINPLLTITALAERAVRQYAVLRGWESRVAETPLAPPPDVDRPPRRQRSATTIRFAERMTGSLELAPGRPETEVRLDVTFADIENIPKFLSHGPHAVEIRKAMLYPVTNYDVEGAKNTDANEAAKVSGTVYWMARDGSSVFGRVVRALWAWVRIRAFADFFYEAREAGWLEALKLLGGGGSIVKLASNVGEARQLRYALRLESDLIIDGKTVLPADTEIDGLKTFRYCFDGNPWRQLSELAVTVRPKNGAAFEAGTLEVDVEHMLRRFAAQFQIVRQEDVPSALLDIASIALFIARVVLKVHFWSFRAPEYERYDPERAQRRLPGALTGLQFQMHEVVVTPKGSEKITAQDGRTPIVLPLSHYWHPIERAERDEHDPKNAPVLLIHGFGASGAQFAHGAMRRNLVRHLAEKGFDVWVAELRTSIALPSSWNQWTLDEIAMQDIPAIVNRVLTETGKAQLDVVAHCIGSAMFCTAALAGSLKHEDPRAEDLHSKVRRATLLQVGPLIELSKGNRFRGHVAAAIRRFALTDYVDSSVDDRADAISLLIDRLLSTYPYPDSEVPHHRLCPPWVAHTHLANCNRSAGIFGRLIQHANVDPVMLDALGDLLGQTNLKTFEQTVQYAFFERLTDYDAVNAYVTDANVREHFNFPVLFLHGQKNDVFDPKTTQRSQQFLLDIFGKAHPALREVLPGYGHLDPLIGAHAERDVFGKISSFLEQEGLDSTSYPPKRVARYARPPLIGPVLGWTRKVDGKWVARIWCRTDDRQSYPAFLMTLVFDHHGHPVAGHAFSVPLQYAKDYVTFDFAGELDLHALADVRLPDIRVGDTEIVVLGAHATAEVDPEEERLQTRPKRTFPQSASQYASLELGPIENEWYYATLTDPEGRSDILVPEPQPLDPEYAAAIAEARNGDAAKRRRENRERAQFPDDSGYETRPDAVRIDAALLERLDKNGTIEFALASCRYPAMMLDRAQADALFGRLRTLLRGDGGPPPSLLLLAGDQIYADATAGLFDPKTRRGRFYDAYYEAWTAPNAREVLRSLPTYMMMDDHEAGDDWHPGDVEIREGTDREMHRWAMTAFEEHQLAHSPWNTRVPGSTSGERPAPYRGGYWYDFDAAGFGFFVCDTRSQREDRSRIMSQEQHGALAAWLRAQQRTQNNRPKFVLSPSVVAPFLKSASGEAAYSGRSDGWQGYPDSLRALLSQIATDGIENVVFLCGDPHCSMTSELEIKNNERTLKALCVVASPMYAPYPFANARPQDFSPEAEFVDGGVTMRYARDGNSIVEGDSFTTVGAQPDGNGWKITVRVYGSEGDPSVTTYDLP